MTPYQLGMRVLTPERVRIVRAMHDQGLAPMTHLARECNVSVKTISKIVRRESYKDVAEVPAVLEPFAGKVILGVQL